MNKNNNDGTVGIQDLVRLSKERCSVTTNDISLSLRAVLASISKSVSDGKSVIIPGFGKFEQRMVKEHEVTLPSGKRITIKEHKTVRFRPYKGFTLYYMS